MVALGNTNFVKEFEIKKVSDGCDEVDGLSTVARREPQAAHSAFIHGVSSRWNYVMRTIPGISDMMIPLEETIRHKLIPAITGRNAVSDIERDVLAMPSRLGGMGMVNPTKSCA